MREERKKERKKKEEKKAPTETGPLPRSHVQDLFVYRVRGNPSLRRSTAVKDYILGRNKTRLALWEEHLKDPIVALDKALESWSEDCLVETVTDGRRWPPSKFVGKKPIWEGVWSYLDPWDSVRLRTASMVWIWPGKYGPHGELLFFLIQQEPRLRPVDETFSSFFNAGICAPSLFG